jgi:hypothetical protein
LCHPLFSFIRSFRGWLEPKQEVGRTVKICSVSRPEAFSLEAVLMVAQQVGRAQLRFDYGDSTLAPTREKVNRDGVKENVTWSSVAMASEACKQDMDEAVLKLLVSQ